MSDPLVSVIVPHHFDENKKYLDLCLDSLARQEECEVEVVVVSAAKEIPHKDRKLKNIVILDAPQAKHFSEKINLGVKASNPKSKYIMVGNDDVVYSKYALAVMTQAMGDNKIIMNGFSNCDNGWYFQAPFPLMGKNKTGQDRTWVVPKQFSYEEFPMELYDGVINYPIGTHALFQVDFCAFYSTLIPRSVWSELSGLDETYRTGWEDRDFCYRARDKGYGSFVNTAPFIMHFGGKSIKGVTKEDQAVNEKHFAERWVK